MCRYLCPPVPTTLFLSPVRRGQKTGRRVALVESPSHHHRLSCPTLPFIQDLDCKIQPPPLPEDAGVVDLSSIDEARKQVRLLWSVSVVSFEEAYGNGHVSALLITLPYQTMGHLYWLYLYLSRLAAFDFVPQLLHARLWPYTYVSPMTSAAITSLCRPMPSPPDSPLGSIGRRKSGYLEH